METPQAGPDAALFTLGHSNHSQEEFLGLLRQHRIDLVVDVRTSPYSRYADQFNKEVLQNYLHAQGFAYRFLGDVLGGRPEGGEFYDRDGHVLYGKLAESDRFQQALARLLTLAQGRCAVILCGEEDPASCHRRLLIGRVLTERGRRVVHIRGDGRLQTEQQLAEEEHFRKTKGQRTLFDMDEEDEWKSTQSVSPPKQPPNSSRRSDV